MEVKGSMKKFKKTTIENKFLIYKKTCDMHNAHIIFYNTMAKNLYKHFVLSLNDNKPYIWLQWGMPSLQFFSPTSKSVLPFKKWYWQSCDSCQKYYCFWIDYLSNGKNQYVWHLLCMFYHFFKKSKHWLWGGRKYITKNNIENYLLLNLTAVLDYLYLGQNE